MKSVKVRDYMATRLVIFHQSDSAIAAMSVLLDNKISGGPVVDDDGNLVGVLSEVDLMEVVIQNSYYNESTGLVADFMKREVETVDVEMDIYALAVRFHKEHRRRYPVVQNGRLVGQVSRRDVLRAAQDFLLNTERKKPKAR